MPRSPRQRVRLLAIVAILAVLSGGIGVLALRRAPPPPIVGMVRVTEVQIEPEVSGRVAALPFKAGDRVPAGALVAELSNPELAASVQEAHAAVAPYLGINAVDAITVAQVAIGLLRQQLVPGQMVHGIVTDGGQATNIIPARAEMQYTMRANDAASLRELPAGLVVRGRLLL